MSYLNASPSKLLLENIGLFSSLNMNKDVLDLACGCGRNGLFLLENEIPVVFADKDKAALAGISNKIGVNVRARHKVWRIDLEKDTESPLGGESYSAVLVFNYLHRPLLPGIQAAISKAGLIFYETFTNQQPNFGRPRNPNFLLNENELLRKFEGWEIINYFEGIKSNPQRAVASLIARKP